MPEQVLAQHLQKAAGGLLQGLDALFTQALREGVKAKFHIVCEFYQSLMFAE
ncbi:MAG: hypothetical protein U0797_03260 [Gemmataceae bacterium]